VRIPDFYRQLQPANVEGAIFCPKHSCSTVCGSPFAKIAIFHHIGLLQLKFERLSFKIKKKFLTPNYFLKVGYYPGFYSSLSDEN
jgi:hypothetical protein